MVVNDSGQCNCVASDGGRREGEHRGAWEILGARQSAWLWACVKAGPLQEHGVDVGQTGVQTPACSSLGKAPLYSSVTWSLGHFSNAGVRTEIDSLSHL